MSPLGGAFRPTIMRAYLTGVRCLVLLFALLVSAPATHAAGLERVLLLHSFGADYSPWDETAISFRAELFSLSPEPIDLYEA